MSSQDSVQRAKAVADAIRELWPDKAAEIDRAIAALNAGQRDGLKVTTGLRFRLEKFDGEMTPGKQPAEVIEGEG